MNRRGAADSAGVLRRKVPSSPTLPPARRQPRTAESAWSFVSLSQWGPSSSPGSRQGSQTSTPAARLISRQWPLRPPGPGL